MGRKVYHDIKGACEYANVDRRTIYNWIKRGILVDGRRVFLAVRILDGVNLINEIDFDNYLIEIGYNPEEENNDTIEQQSKKGEDMAENETLDPEDVLEYLEDIMQENELRPSQKIDTLIQAIDGEIEEEEE